MRHKVEKPRCEALTQIGTRCRIKALPGLAYCFRHRHLLNAKQEKQKSFLLSFARFGRLDKARKVAGVTENAHDVWMRDDPDYPDKYEAARMEFVKKEIQFRQRVAYAAKRQIYRLIITGKASPGLLMFASKCCPHDGWKEYGSWIEEEGGKEMVSGLIDALRKLDKEKPRYGQLHAAS